MIEWLIRVVCRESNANRRCAVAVAEDVLLSGRERDGLLGDESRKDSSTCRSVHWRSVCLLRHKGMKSMLPVTRSRLRYAVLVRPIPVVAAEKSDNKKLRCAVSRMIRIRWVSD
jgi:hypothetical protein